jgi:hypothetical protein
VRSFRNIPRDEISLERILTAIDRRVRNISHSLAWQIDIKRNSPNLQRIVAYKNAYQGERCFILGNGPSLARMDLKPLRSEFTFGLNRIYLLFEEMGFETSFLVCMNDLVLKQSWSEIRNVKTPKFINWRARDLFQDSNEDIIFLYETFIPQFSEDISRKVWGGATVTFVALQIAFYLGFEQVFLIGIDHRFKTKGIPHRVVVSGQKDDDHFHPKYFANGTLWQLPDLRTSEFAYSLAKEAYDGGNRVILDATLDGNLKVFPKILYQDAVRKTENNISS